MKHSLYKREERQCSLRRIFTRTRDVLVHEFIVPPRKHLTHEHIRLCHSPPFLLSVHIPYGSLSPTAALGSYNSTVHSIHGRYWHIYISIKLHKMSVILGAMFLDFVIFRYSTASVRPFIMVMYRRAVPKHTNSITNDFLLRQVSSIGTFRVLKYRMVIVIHFWRTSSFDLPSTVLCWCPTWMGRASPSQHHNVWCVHVGRSKNIFYFILY